MEWCESCAKNKYDGYEAAKYVSRGKRSHVRLSTYKCPLGGGFHLTSQIFNKERYLASVWHKEDLKKQKYANPRFNDYPQEED